MKAEDLPDFDVANYLLDEEQIQAYLAAVAQENNPELSALALEAVARTRKRWGLPAPGDGSTHQP